MAGFEESKNGRTLLIFYNITTYIIDVCKKISDHPEPSLRIEKQKS